MEGINIKDHELEHWYPLLREWIFLVNKYCARIDDDPVYCHLERANVSLLCAAAWRIGWMAVQELWVERQGNNSFCDLYLCPDEKEPEYIEAKIALEINSVEEYLSKAEKQIGSFVINEENGFKRIPLCFINPSISKEANANIEIEGIIKKSFEIEYDVLAWCFPEKTRNYNYDEKNINPGILLFARNRHVRQLNKEFNFELS